MHKKIFPLLFILVLFIVCSIIIYNEIQQFDYLYLDGIYYVLTGEDLASQGGASGSPLGHIHRNARISAHQQDGDSNVLPVGTTIYTVNTGKLSDLNRLHYKDTVTYEQNGVFYIARRYWHRGDPLPTNTK